MDRNNTNTMSRVQQYGSLQSFQGSLGVFKIHGKTGKGFILARLINLLQVTPKDKTLGVVKDMYVIGAQVPQGVIEKQAYLVAQVTRPSSSIDSGNARINLLNPLCGWVMLRCQCGDYYIPSYKNDTVRCNGCDRQLEPLIISKIYGTKAMYS